MPDAFTAGVKPGGLNDTAQIRILLCYLVKSAGPVSRQTLEGALLQEELVNWFELGDALAEVEKNGLLAAGPDGYAITEKGSVVAQELTDGVPRSVRDSAIRAVLRIQSWKHKAAVNHARVERAGSGYAVVCALGEDTDEILQLRLTLPDAGTAEAVKNRFIARGSEIYAQLMDTFSAPGTADDEPPEALL